ncbi:MAG: OB-fold nucleic acid binding domain-containing protein, partial [bacterium]|nr:OB-fold nucleic acid binding domain-containing protein [bacterium]
MRKDLVDERLKKLSKLKETGVNPYPIKTTRSLEIGVARKSFSKLSKSNKKVSLVGRIFSIRDQGGVVFYNIKDETGSLQVIFKKESTKNFKLHKETLDRGDFISVTGPLSKTQRG